MIDNKPLAVIAGKRTPMCKASTELASLSAVQLGTHAVVSAVQSAAGLAEGFDLPRVEELVMGNVSSPPDAANLARVIALSAGMDVSRVAHTVNRNCASGMESIIAAWDSIRGGRASIVVAGGTESMSQIPLLYSKESTEIWMRLMRCRSMKDRLKVMARFRPRHFTPVPGVQLGLTDPISGLNMGETGEVLAREFEITREEQDQYALRSHQRAATARQRCFLSGEIAPIALGSDASVSKDNGPRDQQSIEQLGKLKPIFDRSGTITAGNSCPLTDGAAALVLGDARTAMQFGKPLGYITDYAIAGCEPHRMGLGPVYATAKLLARTGHRMQDFDLIELNEAFAAQVIACQRAAESTAFARKELGRDQPLGAFPDSILNIHGGAIALGHPVGMTGTRLILTLLRSLRESGGKLGLATLCVGGGQGVAMIVQTELED